MARVNAELKLNAEERNIYNMMKDVRGENPYLIECRRIKSRKRLHQMIDHFYSQSKTSYTLTEIIVGKKLLEAIVAFKSKVVSEVL